MYTFFYSAYICIFEQVENSIFTHLLILIVICPPMSATKILLVCWGLTNAEDSSAVMFIHVMRWPTIFPWIILGAEDRISGFASHVQDIPICFFSHCWAFRHVFPSEPRHRFYASSWRLSTSFCRSTFFIRGFCFSLFLVVVLRSDQTWLRHFHLLYFACRKKMSRPILKQYYYS